MSEILSGSLIREQIKRECKPRVEALAASARAPGLAVILAGNDPASEIYVRHKIATCAELGIHSEQVLLPATTSTDELLTAIRELNARDDIDGILVQMPLPAHVDSKSVLLAVDPSKDVDGFHPCNLGNLLTGRPGPRPCTPAGIMEMLRRYGIRVSGRRAVVVGRSEIVGKPMAFLLLQEHATVTICHSRTQDLAAICRHADILVAAIGKPALIQADAIRPGAIVIDVGMNRVKDREEVSRLFDGSPDKLSAFDRTGSLLVGDVDPAAMAERSAAYTPVPGGVGPLTIAMLMVNAIAAAERRLGRC